MSALGGIHNSVTCATGTVSQTGGGRADSVSETYAPNPAVSTTARPPSAMPHDGDKLEISELGKLLSSAAELARKLGEVPDTREDAIDTARRMIESGELFSDDAIHQAAHRLKRFLRPDGE